MAHLLVECTHLLVPLAHRVSLLRLVANQEGMSQVAKDAGLSRESLYRALSAEGNPSFATVLKVARALGVKLHAQAA